MADGISFPGCGRINAADGAARGENVASGPDQRERVSLGETGSVPKVGIDEKGG